MGFDEVRVKVDRRRAGRDRRRPTRAKKGLFRRCFTLFGYGRVEAENGGIRTMQGVIRGEAGAGEMITVTYRGISK